MRYLILKGNKIIARRNFGIFLDTNADYTRGWADKLKLFAQNKNLEKSKTSKLGEPRFFGMSQPLTNLKFMSGLVMLKCLEELFPRKVDPVGQAALQTYITVDPAVHFSNE